MMAILILLLMLGFLAIKYQANKSINHTNGARNKKKILDNMNILLFESWANNQFFTSCQMLVKAFPSFYTQFTRCYHIY